MDVRHRYRCESMETRVYHRQDEVIITERVWYGMLANSTEMWWKNQNGVIIMEKNGPKKGLNQEG